ALPWRTRRACWRPAPIFSPCYPISSTPPTSRHGPRNTESSSHEKPRTVRTRAAAYPGGSEFPGARVSRRRRHAAVLRARLGRLSVGCRGPALYRLPWIVGPDGGGAYPRRGGQGG